MPTKSSRPIDLEIDRRLWEKNTRRYFHDCLKIQDEHGKLVEFSVNPHQEIVLKEIERQKKLGIPVRIVVLKPRKTGTSTITQGVQFHAVRFTPADALVVAHDVSTTEYLFSMARRFYDNLPPEEQLPLEASNRKELHFARRPDSGLEGRILVSTAGTKTSGRGYTPLYLHLSEAAYYENAEEVMNSLLNSVPDTPESIVLVESTANTATGYFYDMCMKAINNTSAFVFIFLSWKDYPKYSMPVANPQQFETSLSSYERRIQAEHKLTLEQLYWRRWVVNTKLKGDAELFKQEYPLTPMEAFLHSGRARFDREAIMRWPIQEPLKGYLQSTDLYSGKQLSFIPNRDGYLRVFKRPIPNHNYVIGADVAEGIEVEGASSEDKYDWSSAHVLDADTGETSALFLAQVEPDEFGRQLYLLGRWYNHAYTAVERNNNGLTVINEMVNSGYPEAKMYKRETSPDGARYSVPQKGWVTNIVTRNMMINHLAQSIREASLIIYSQETQRECLSFVIKPNGKAEANTGAKDDQVISLSIAAMMLNNLPRESDNKVVFDLPGEKVISYRPKKFSNARSL